MLKYGTGVLANKWTNIAFVDKDTTKFPGRPNLWRVGC